MAQIGMLRRELVDGEGWISSERFNRTLAVYQALPGPEAHELCVHFGLLARGRWGGLVAGLGFMLPGFALMMGASAFYLAIGIAEPWFAAAFAGTQAAVLALIVRAVHRIGAHGVTDAWLGVIAAIAFSGALFGASFVVVLAAAGIGYVVVSRGGMGLRLLTLGAMGGLMVLAGLMASFGAESAELPGPGVVNEASSGELVVSGLRAGLLTFGGAYTAIPFVQRDAVDVGGWMSTGAFLDGVALSGVLPAPLIIFVTFVGFVAGGPLGALAITAAAFAPAFAFTLFGHEQLERVIQHTGIRRFLDGVMAGVVGLIAATAVHLAPQVLTAPSSVAIFAAALAVLYTWPRGIAVVAAVVGGAVLGLVFGTPI